MTKAHPSWRIHSGGPDSPVRYTLHAPHLNAAAEEAVRRIGQQQKQKLRARRLSGSGASAGTFVALLEDSHQNHFKTVGNSFYIDKETT